MSQALSGASARPDMRRAVLAATMGNGLEFYDFLTFAFFAIQIGHTFFPSSDPYLSLMGSLATFGAGFIGRPIGAYVLGGYADRVGRRTIMLFSMTLMGIAIAILALTPGYATIGVAAPVIAIICRLAQGFALGGEVGAATVYMVEAAPHDRRGRAASWQGVSQAVGASLGSLMGFILSSVMSEAELSSYGWRIALLLGVCVVPFAMIIRRTLPETLHEAAAERFDSTNLPSLRRIVILGVIILGAGTIASYIFDYMATFGQTQLNMSPQFSMAGQLANNVAAAIACYAGGILCDHYGRRRLLIWPQLIFCLGILPAFMWITSMPGLGVFITANILLSVVNNLMGGPLYATVAESIDPRLRSRAFALIYAVPITFLGGTTQLFITWLLKVTGSPLSIAWYLTGVSIIGLGAMLLLPESSPLHRKDRKPKLVPAA